MKYILTFLLLFVSQYTYAATCTSPSRSNVAANSVLTSTEYNNSLNALYSFAAAIDLGCASAGTLDDTLTLNSTEFNALLNGVKEGCVVTNTDSNTLSVDNCMMAVNGNFVKTTTATTVTWGCTSCSAEVATTIYYLYAKTGSEGTTLNLLISTSAPNADGYDGSGNRVLAVFVNNFSSNIESVLNAVQGNRFDKNWYLNVNVGGANPDLGTVDVASYTQVENGSLDLVVNSGSALARIPCSSTNTPSGLTCSAGNEVVGASFVVPVAGTRMEICAAFSAEVDLSATSSTVQLGFQLVETATNATTILAEGNGRSYGRLSHTDGTSEPISAYPFRTCGTFTFASAGQKVIKLSYELDATGAAADSVNVIANRGASFGQIDVQITGRPIYQ